MDTPFTKINLSMFMTYISLLSMKFYGDRTSVYLRIINHINRLLGAVTFNTSMAVMLPWESTRFLYPHAAQHFLDKTCEAYNISRPVFEFLNFVAHIFPPMYLWMVRKHWSRFAAKPQTIFISMFIHYSWVRFITKDYNLNRIYMWGDKILNDNQWIKLWMIAFMGHCSSYIFSSTPMIDHLDK